MPGKPRFPPEPETKPDYTKAGPRRSSPVPKSKRDRSEAPTIPPPKPRAGSRSAPAARNSGMRTRRSEPSQGAATVDEVTADLSKDPRRESEGDERD